MEMVNLNVHIVMEKKEKLKGVITARVKGVLAVTVVTATVDLNRRECCA
jgi:hypothetical protein